MRRRDRISGPQSKRIYLIRPMTPRIKNMVFIVVLAIVAVAMYVSTIINVGFS